MKYGKYKEPSLDFIKTFFDDKLDDGYTEITEEEYNSLNDQNIKSNGWYQITLAERNNKEVLYNRMWYKPVNDDITKEPDFNQPLIPYNDKILTCDEALQEMDYYRDSDDDEDIEKYNVLKALRNTAKSYIKGLFE